MIETPTQLIERYILERGNDCPQCEMQDYSVPTIDPTATNKITCGVCGHKQDLRPEVFTRIARELNFLGEYTPTFKNNVASLIIKQQVAN